MRWLLPLFVLGCTNQRPEETGIEETGIDPNCDPVLSLTAPYAAVLPHHPIQLDAAGGTGDYRYHLADSESGAILNSLSGAYLASDIVGTVDEITVTDEGCEGQASFSITTLDAFTVEPEQLSLLPGTVMSPEMTGGSGNFECALKLAPSGATLDNCTYAAGAAAGNDILQITDMDTGHVVDIPVSVDSEAGLGDLISQVLLPVGASYNPNASGGSEVFDYTVLSGDINVAGGKITATQAGEAVVHIADRFAGFEATLTINAADVISPPTQRDGEMVQHAHISSPGDLNNDGLDDVIFGVYSASYDAHFGGMVSIYAGDADGNVDTPAQTIGGDDNRAKFGVSFATGDFDGDGNQDLAVGASDGPSLSYRGEVEIFAGVSDAFFDDTPSLTLEADYSGDRLGASMASCDLDLDGYDDLIVGASYAEDRSVSPYLYTQGGLYIYMGSPVGLSDRADTYRWGPVASYYLGAHVVSGDFDGDGHCDILAGAEYYKSGASDQEGAAALFYNDTVGSLETSPSLFFEGPGRMSHKMAVGDLDDDGILDVTMGAFNASNPAGQTKAGAVAVFLGASLQSHPAGTTIQMDTADWLLYGSKGNQYMGRSVAIGDGNNDGIDDLVVGISAGELSGSPSNAGVIQLYLGGSSTQPTDPTQQWTLDESYAYLGSGLGYAGHLNDDGLGDWLAFSDRSVITGPDGGAPFWISTADVTPVPLTYAHKSSGHGFGKAHSMALFHLNDDAYIDLVFSGSEAGNEDNNQGNVGILYAMYGTADGFETTPTKLDLYDREWSANSRRGHAITPAGTFTGGSFDNLVILSRDESKPGSLDGSVYADTATCAGAVGGGGSATIYAGSSTGVEDNPSFVYFGPHAYDDVRSALGNIDVNGDDRPDVVVGSDLWHGSRGGFTVLHGRNVTSSKTEVLCDTTEVDGASGSDKFAYRLANLGDLNNDGCDDIAASAPKDSTQGGDGSVTIVWGWDETCTGATCCPAEPTVTTLKTELEDTLFGEDLASIDLDQDGLNELIIGGPSDSIGHVWVVNGVAMQALTGGPLDQGNLPDTDQGNTWYVEDLSNTLTFDGASGFGTGLAVTPHPTETGSLLAIGDTTDAGEILLFGFSASKPTGEIIAIVSGESHQPGGNFGAGLLLQAVDGKLVLVAGAPAHDAPDGVDQGGLYPFSFDLLSH